MRKNCYSPVFCWYFCSISTSSPPTELAGGFLCFFSDLAWEIKFPWAFPEKSRKIRLSVLWFFGIVTGDCLCAYFSRFALSVRTSSRKIRNSMRNIQEKLIYDFVLSFFRTSRHFFEIFTSQKNHTREILRGLLTVLPHHLPFTSFDF